MKAPDVEDLYRLSPMQEGMLFHHLYSPQSDIYFRQQSYTFHGPLNVAAFTRAWERVIERHAVLRASFFWQDLEKPVQVVRRTVDTPLGHQDWRGLPEHEQNERLKTLLAAEHSKGFDITRAPLMRIVIVQVADEVSHFVWSYHHLLMDGWSKYHVLREVVSLYDAFCEGKDLQLPRSRPYRDYISWLKQQDKSGAETFWRDALKGFKVPTPIGSGAQSDSGANAESEYREREVWLTPEATSALKTLAKQHQFTLNTLVQAAWSLLLSRYSGEEDVLFGITVSGRPASLPGVESMVGLFINTLPLRVRVPRDAEVLSWLKTLQAQQAELTQFEQSPLSDVHGWSEVPRSQMLFESILVFDNFPVDANVRTHRELRFTPLASVERNNYPLTLVAFADERLLLRIPYDTQRFESAAIERMLGHLQSLLEGMAANPHQRLCEVPLITRAERERLLSDLDNTGHPLSHDLTVHELFEAQAERTPEATAVRLGPESLNYRELNERANQLAHHLHELGVGPEVRVGICAERSIEMLVGLLGILKAGGVYVPLDPSFPQERLSYLLEDLEVPVLLTQDHLLFELPPYAAASQIVCLDSDWSAISACSPENPEKVLTGDNLAYIIYTSGSTGTPKGVCIPHRVAANHFLTAQREFRLDSKDVVLEFASFNFDVSLEQIFVPLFAGATLVLRDARTWGREDFFQHAAEYGLTVVNFPPAYWTQVVPAPGSEIAEELAARLKLVIIGGDQMQPSTARMWQQAGLRDVRLLNAYGPTEATITATTFDVPLITDANGAQMPIGRPLAQRAIYILDQQGSPVPVGVVGEMHIGGPLLARGYLNRPGLTAEKFVPDPFSEQPGARMYRTGDQVALSEDGNIRFLGRVDQQVKIRGYRIELGEIEAALYACEGVRNAAVIVTEQVAGEKKLIGYVVLEAGTTAASVRERLRERLPEYMIPSAFVVLDEMPLTPNGKVDRRALPAPDEARVREVDGCDNWSAPRTPIEEMLVDIFAGVLDVERVGVEDNFFELGGHSLLVTQVVSRIRESLNVELPVRAVFEYPTASALAGQVEAESRAGHEAPPPLVRRELVEGMPLSFAQARLWFLDQFEPGSSAYNMPFALRLKGALDVEALERAMTEIVRRHEVLRTRFAVVEGEPVQVVDEPAPFVLPVEESEPDVQAVIQEEASRAFDLEAGPVVRAKVLKVGADEHVLLFTMHHIVSDGWSMGVLMREVGALYNAYSRGDESPLPELAIQYGDYAVWQREWLQGEALERQLKYWRQQLADAPVIELPTEKTRPAVLSPVSARAEVRISAEAVAGLRELGRREGCTLFMTLLAAFQIVLWRYTRQSDLVVGTPVANRGQGGTEGLIGFFVNTLALRTELDQGLTFRELLARVRETCLGAYAHQDVPFEKLVEELGVRRELNRNPLFDVMMALQGGDDNGLRLEGLEVSAGTAGSGAAAAKFDLLLGLVEERDGGVRGKLEYRGELFGETLMRRMAARLSQVVQEAAASKGETRLNDLGLVTGEEREVQLTDWNATAREYDLDVCLHQLFEKQTARTPDATALISGGERLTYRELDARATKLAHRLNAFGVGPETVVGLLFERSTELVISVLGVLKAGAAYLPLDPSYPAARLRYVFEDAAPRVLLTTEALLSQWGDVGPQSHADVLYVEQLELDEASAAAPAPVTSGVEANNLAYVIYTSGSTGRPKGVGVTHGNLLNFLLSMQAEPGLTAADTLVAVTTLSFDIAGLELYLPLISGARLVLAERETTTDGHRLLKLLRESQATVMQATPATWRLLLDALAAEELTEPLELKVLCGGEALPGSLAAELRATFDGGVYNLYGPTETTIWSARHEVNETDAETPIVSLGGPIANTQLYLLDEALQPVPVGVRGELYIGGDGVARGYRNRGELTAERFVPDPFSKRGGQRLYRTGDACRYLANGEIEYLGRSDQQVKLRGYRIELGEIESALRDCEGVRDAAVVLSERADGDNQLVGYLVTQTAATDRVREYLRQRLPEYMVPSVFVRLDALPLTPSGKLDRRALPAPESVATETDHIAPRTPVEELLALIFAEVLKIQKIGTDQSFFDLGGHSLLATKVVSRVREAFRVEVTLRSLFERPTVAEFSRHLEACLKAGKTTTAPPIRRIDGDGAAPLSFAQQRLWFFEQLQPGTTTYNLLQSVRLLGALNLSALERSLNEILKRHESLRTTFRNINGEPVQQTAPASPLTLPVTDLSDLPEADREAEVRRLSLEELNRPFDLARGPLVRARLLKLDAETYVALFIMHHIVTDAWSMGVLLRELKVLYEAFCEERPSPLAELPVQYTDFARWQREWLSGEALEEQVSYWQERLAGNLPVLTLPADKPRPDTWTYRGAKHSVAFSKELTEALKAFGNEQRATLFMTLLAAFQVLLHYYTGEEDIVVGTDDANRGRLETEPLIGFFINQLALRTDLSGNPTFKDLLERVREVTLGAYANHDLPFAKIVERLRPERSLAHAPIFQVKLVLQNTPVEELELRGLKLQPLQVDYAAAKFDLTPLLWEKPDGLRGWFEYSSDLFSPAAIARIAEQFEVVLKSVAARPELTLEQFRDVLAEDDRERRARAQRDREESQRSRFKSIKPKAVSLSEQTLVQMSELIPGVRLPLVVQPATNKLDLEEWTKANLGFIETKLHKHGAILFRGFDVNSPSIFEGFAHAICPTLFDENGEHNRGSVSGKIYTPVAYPANKLLLWHNENSFNDAWPMKIWFCCATPAAQGGETPLVDSRRVFEMLDPKIRERFVEKKVMYVRNYKEGLGQSWQSIMRASNRAEAEEFCRKNGMEFEWKEGNGLVTRCVRPAAARHPRTGEMVWFNQAQHWHRACLDDETRESLRALFGDDDFPRDCYYGDGSVIEDSMMEEILEVYRQLEVSFPWRAKDVVMLDNMLTAHGRNPYVGERKLYVAMGEMTSYAEVLAAEAGSFQLAERI